MVNTIASKRINKFRKTKERKATYLQDSDQFLYYRKTDGKMIKNGLTWSLDSDNISDISQSGFRKNKSTAIYFYFLFNKISINIHKKRTPPCSILQLTNRILINKNKRLHNPFIENFYSNQPS